MRKTAKEYLNQTYILQSIEVEEADFKNPQSMTRVLIEHKKPTPDIVEDLTNYRSAQSYVDFIESNMSPDAIQQASSAATKVEPILKKLFDLETQKREEHRAKDPSKLTKEDILAAMPRKVEDAKRLKLIEKLMIANLDMESVEILSLNKEDFIQTQASVAYSSLTGDEIKLLTAFYSHPDVKRERQLYFYRTRHYMLVFEKLLSMS
ncbi:MAG: hypothetical protein AB8C84_10695 [Oligoflexales bacterium]